MSKTTGDFICPKCGFKFSVKDTRTMKCRSCGKELYGEYPRIALALWPSLYEPKVKAGYLCSKCATKLGITTKEIEDTT